MLSTKFSKFETIRKRTKVGHLLYLAKFITKVDKGAHLYLGRNGIVKFSYTFRSYESLKI